MKSPFKNPPPKAAAAVPGWGALGSWEQSTCGARAKKWETCGDFNGFHGDLGDLVTGWWFGTCFIFPYNPLPLILTPPNNKHLR